MITPLYEITAKHDINHFFIKREDLYPYAFGGNKARIALEYIADMKSKGCDCLIGYGNSRSNLNRALAFLTAQYSVPFHVVSPLDDDGTNIETFNSKLSIMNGAVFHKCSKSNVAETVEKVINYLNSQGAHPYYINGDKYGKGNEMVPVRAYAKTYYEIVKQANELGVDFDYIFLATGTGMTLAGLLTSQAKEKGKEKIIGISVARDTDTAEQYVQRFCDQFCKNRIEKVSPRSIHVVDDYRCGGYGKSCVEETNLISDVLKKYGIPLDPTYTGKAFWGMLKYIQSKEIKNSNVLFIHTGGTPAFYDYLTRPALNISIRECKSPTELESVLQEVDHLLPTPLSKRVDLAHYSKKVVEYGHALFAEVNGIIAGLALYYSNDFEQHKGYLTLLATAPSYRRCGIAKDLLKQVENNLIQDRMEYLRLETEVNNTPAVSFYSSMGYRVIDKADKLIMEKVLII